mmetsp:Transcript_13460/g.27470  ORF Transcript_13460/g.27470 Transcript_13460/m.27470 type:complete len:89 (-) Transcript_13460:8-274(-)
MSSLSSNDNLKPTFLALSEMNVRPSIHSFTSFDSVRPEFTHLLEHLGGIRSVGEPFFNRVDRSKFAGNPLSGENRLREAENMFTLCYP